jgi:hypothetical protein
MGCDASALERSPPGSSPLGSLLSTIPISPLEKFAAPSGRESIAMTISTTALKWNAADSTHADTQRSEPTTVFAEPLAEEV